MAFEVPKHGKGEVDKAGIVIADVNDLMLRFLMSPKVEHAIDVVDNWRASHSYPMQIIRNNLANRANKVDPDAIIAQRLKRFVSITDKLRREPTMKLSQMQDIGGCRAIMLNVVRAEELVKLHEQAWDKNPRRHELHRRKDYISQPKSSGYRGVHLIYKFKSQNPKYSSHNGQRIEVQVRSRIQHIWATAVEVVGAFTEQALKSSQGSNEWRRLFSLMGSIFAEKENREPVPDTPTGIQLRQEIKSVAKQIKAEEFLSACSSATVNMEQQMANAAAYVLVLDVLERRVRINPCKDMTTANRYYAEAERRNRDKPNIQVVLVSVDSFGALRKAYPNYYLDVSQFLQELRDIVL